MVINIMPQVQSNKLDLNPEYSFKMNMLYVIFCLQEVLRGVSRYPRDFSFSRCAVKSQLGQG